MGGLESEGLECGVVEEGEDLGEGRTPLTGGRERPLESTVAADLGNALGDVDRVWVWGWGWTEEEVDFEGDEDFGGDEGVGVRFVVDFDFRFNGAVIGRVCDWDCVEAGVEAGAGAEACFEGEIWV